MEEARAQAIQSLLQFIFWLTLGMTVFCCFMWTLHQDAIDDPEETETHRISARTMIPTYLKNAALSGLVCLSTLIVWKFMI